MRTRGHLAFLSWHRVERMENDLLEELAKGEALELGQGLEDLDHAPLHPDTDLDAIDGRARLCRCWDHGTNVPWDHTWRQGGSDGGPACRSDARALRRD